ncbi:MAG: alpha/beta hydrolase [Gemmatimonadota bacterium]|nr:MAG: alpha/beta hydrolase [Gemmatimonadota bacterium]
MTIRHTQFEFYNEDGDPVRGDVWCAGNARADAAIVICHGFKGFKNWGFFPYTSEQLAYGTSYPVVQFNFSGNGIGPDLENFTELDKFEQNTFSKELDDLKLVLDAAEAGELPGLLPRERFGLLGHSRGGLSAIVTAAEDPRVVALVTWSAVAQIDRWTEEQKEEWRRVGRIEILNTRTGQMMPLGVVLLEDAERNADRFNLERVAARLEVPYLIVHGTQDESVSIADGERLAAAAPEESTRFERIAGASHTFGAVHPFAGPTEHLDRAVDLSAGWFAVYLEE